MNNDIPKLIEISEYLKETDITILLHNMKKMLDNGNYVLTVMGQFSAGKSTLINELVGKKVLPVNKTETTAVVTYLRYGAEERAELVYSDGTIIPCSIEETMQLEQNTDSPEKLEKLESINIFIPSELFSNGLIIADTPGVNTVLKEHTEKTLQLFDASSRILYVVSGAMSLFDKQFLTTIKNNGLKSLVVRTYMDTIDSCEDDLNKVMEKSTEQFSSFTDDPIFFTSSKTQSSFYENIANLRTYLINTISNQADEQLQASMTARLLHIAQQMLPLICQREQALSAILDHKDAEFQKQKSELEDKAEKLRQSLKKGKEKLGKRYEQLKVEAAASLQVNTEQAINSLSDYIRQIDFTAPLSVHSDIEAMLQKSCIDLRRTFVSGFDQIIHENSEEIISELDANGTPISLSVELPDNMEEAGETVAEIQSKITALIALQDDLDAEVEERKQTIANGSADKMKIEEEIGNINEAVRALQQELDEYGEYVERYRIRRGDHKHEKGMRAVGRIADFATILIPGEAWVSLGGKAAKAIMGGAKAVEEGGKLVKGADLAADVIRGLHMLKKNGIAEKEQIALLDSESGSTEDYASLMEQLQTKSDTPGILDLLSIEYYFSKIGKHFDQPDVIEVDEAHKQQYETGRKAIVKRIEAEARKAADVRIDIGKIEDRQEQEKIYLKELAKRKEKQAQEINALNLELAKARSRQINDISASHYIKAVSEYLKDFSLHMSSDVLPIIQAKFDTYLEAYGVDIEGNITAQLNALQKLEEDYSSEDREVVQKELDLCKYYHSELE